MPRVDIGPHPPNLKGPSYAARRCQSPHHVCIRLGGSDRQQLPSAWRTMLMQHSCFVRWKSGRDVSRAILALFVPAQSTDRHLYMFGVKKLDAENTLAAMQEQQLTRVRSVGWVEGESRSQDHVVLGRHHSPVWLSPHCTLATEGLKLEIAIGIVDVNIGPCSLPSWAARWTCRAVGRCPRW